MCLFSRLIRNRKYEPNKKNGGIAPIPVDARVLWTPIGCGECMECRGKKRREWQVRLQEDIKKNRNGKFVLLTFSNESIRELRDYVYENKEAFMIGYDLDNAIATAAVHLFRERFRRKYGHSPRHWFVTELGHKGTENIHLHGIIWTDKTLDEVEERWRYGWVGRGKKRPDGSYINYVSNRSVNYCVKYVTKIDADHRYYNPLILCSPGIGGNYKERERYAYCERWLQRSKKGKWYVQTVIKYTYGKWLDGDWQRHIYKEGKTKESYKTASGTELGLPVYFRNKVFDEETREKLWLEKLNGNKRYVLGKEVEADSEGFWNMLRVAQEKSNRLGYGNGYKDWERYEYEQSRRVIMQNKRMRAS